MNAPQPIAVKLNASSVIACTKNIAVYTDAIDISNCDTFALSVILAGTGAVSCKIELEQGIVPPAAGNAADANYVVPTGISDLISNLAVKTQKHLAISPVAVRYIRFKITELTNVSTDTVATMFLSLLPRFN